MLTALIRTIILYFLIMAGLRLMGKRQIGELEPSELVLALLISDLAAVPMQDFGIPLINGVLPILTLLSLSMMISVLNLKSIRFRDLICGSPNRYRSGRPRPARRDAPYPLHCGRTDRRTASTGRGGPCHRGARRYPGNQWETIRSPVSASINR